MKKKRLYLIDATAFCYRAFYAFSNLSTSFGQPTNAVYGFVRMLNKTLKDNSPDYIAVCFDVSRDTFRQKKFAEYKLQRPPMPHDLSSQIPFIKEIVSAYGISILEKEGFEADDVMATMARRAVKDKLEVTIISSDKDILQLVNAHTIVFSPYKDEGTTYTAKKVEERFGVGADKITDIIALMGDDVDNIPGVPGIGEKTAVELIKQFGSVEKLLHDLKKLSKEKLKISISENTERIKLNKELAVLDEDMDIDYDLDKLKIKDPDLDELVKIFSYLEFKSFLRELPLKHEPAVPTQFSAYDDKSLKGLGSELFLYAEEANRIFFGINDKNFIADKLGENLKSALVDPGVKKIGHDLKKLKILLAGQGILLEGIYFDTMIAGHLLNPSKPEYSLSDLAFDYLSKTAVLKTFDPETALPLLMQLKPKLEQELVSKSLINLFTDIEMPLVEVLSEMELAGVKLDLEVLKSLSRDIEKRLVKLIEKIYQISGTEFNINSPKQLREILFVQLKLPVFKKSKTGPSTDEEVLRKLSDKHELPAMLLEYRQLMKLKTTYIDALPQLVDKAGKIHTSFNQTVTETGRLSSTNPNLQNIPVKTDIGRQIRRAIIASDKKNCLISCDYSQVELRILAHLSKDENLIEAFIQGKDIHKATASLIYGLSEDDVDDDMRNMAKRVNFGIVYGLTAYGLARDLNIPVDEAQNFIEAYFTRYPRVKDYIQEKIDLAKSEGFVTTISGRRRYIPEINNKNQGLRQFAERQAVNTPIQGSASDLIKLAMIDIQRKIKEKGLHSKMVLQIHDELVFDALETESDVLVGLVRERMENVLKLDVPIKADIKKGQNWLEMEEVK